MPENVPEKSFFFTEKSSNLHISIELRIYTIKDPSSMLKPAVLHSNMCIK